MIEEMIGLFLIGITVGAFVSWWLTYSYMQPDWELGKMMMKLSTAADWEHNKLNTAADWEHNTTLLDVSADWSVFNDDTDDKDYEQKSLEALEALKIIMTKKDETWH